MAKKDKKQGGILSLVLIPAILSLIVTVVRLVGELQGWNPTLFGNTAPDDPEATVGLVGVSWLIPIFGLWFGYKLRRQDPSVKLGKALVYLIVGFLVAIGGMFLLIALDFVVMGTPEDPKVPEGLMWMLVPIGAGVLLAFVGWSRLTVTLFVYGILARIPVVAVTWFALRNEDWDTHYTKLPSTVPPQTGDELFMALATPQLTFWIATTVMFGGIFGCIGGALAGGGKKK